MPAILYVMCGLPYSGKSTLARKFAKQAGISIVSIDEIRESMGFYWGNHDASANDWQRIFKIVDERIVGCLTSGQSVIYDSANQDKASRQKYTNLAESLNCEAKIVFVNISLETIEQRRKANMESGERHHIPEQFYQAALDSFEPPSAEEHTINIDDIMAIGR